MNANEIVRALRNCKAYKTKSDLQTTMLMAADCIEALQAQLAERDREIEQLREAQRWIPVTERPPTEKDADHLGFIMAHSDSMKQSTVCVWHHIFDDGVTTHWMPLPAAPEEGAGE